MSTQNYLVGIDLGSTTLKAIIYDLAGNAVAQANLISLKNSNAETVFERNGVVVKAFLVEHQPAEPAFGFRIEYKGRSVVISGDTRKSDYVVQHSKGADILIHEAMNKDMVKRVSGIFRKLGDETRANHVLNVMPYHTHTIEAAQVTATLFGVGQTASTDGNGDYFIPSLETGAYTVQASAEEYDSGFAFANVMEGTPAVANFDLFGTETPQLAVDPAECTVGPVGGTTPLTVLNLGTGRLTWIAEVVTKQPWLAIVSETTGLDGESIELEYTDLPGAAPRTATVRVTAEGADDSPLDVSVTQQAGSSLPGDVDGNSVVNAVDVQLVINEALGITGPHDCDIDGDGVVNAVDVQLVINAALGM